jgi:fused signal recognition particle receptor
LYGFLDKIKEGLSKTKKIYRIENSMFASFTGENEEFFEELEETLIMADAGADTAVRAVEKLREVTRERGLRGGSEVKAALSEI